MVWHRPGALPLRSAGGIGDKVGWPRWVQLSNNQPVNPAASEAAQYYDMCHFATRIKVRTFVNVGFIDTTCPPSSVYAMYNSLAGPKKMHHDIPTGHAVPPETTAEATKLAEVPARKVRATAAKRRAKKAPAKIVAAVSRVNRRAAFRLVQMEANTASVKI